jgi:hypothetical protein
VLLKVRIYLLLYLGNFVKVLDTDTTSDVLTGFIRTFLESSGFLDEP